MSTTRRKPQEEPARIPHNVWVGGDGAKQVPLAGLLADDPTLRDAELTHDEWEQRLNDYLLSERV